LSPVSIAFIERERVDAAPEPEEATGQGPEGAAGMIFKTTERRSAAGVKVYMLRLIASEVLLPFAQGLA
jgi:hypothetical protein